MYTNVFNKNILTETTHKQNRMLVRSSRLSSLMSDVHNREHVMCGGSLTAKVWRQKQMLMIGIKWSW